MSFFTLHLKRANTEGVLHKALLVCVFSFPLFSANVIAEDKLADTAPFESNTLKDPTNDSKTETLATEPLTSEAVSSDAKDPATENQTLESETIANGISANENESESTDRNSSNEIKVVEDAISEAKAPVANASAADQEAINDAAMNASESTDDNKDNISENKSDGKGSIGEFFGFKKKNKKKKEKTLASTSAEETLSSTRVDTLHDIKDLSYGEVLFDYFTDKNEEAIIKILVAQKRGTLTANKEHSDLLLGQLYIVQGLPKKAEETFNRISKGKVSSRTKNRALLQLVKLHTYQGNIDAAIKILRSKAFIDLSTQGEIERRVLLANLYAKKGDKAGVKKILENVSAESVQGTYLKYNLASANMIAERETYAIPILKELAQGTRNNLESRTLRDQANLSLGAHFVQKEKYQEAQQYLSAVSYKGPLSSAALYYLGWSQMKSEGEKSAFPFWIDLSKRNPADPYVEQSFLARPYTFEKLNSSYLALNGYVRATSIYKQLLADLDKTIAIIDSASWLEKLQPQSLETVGMYEKVASKPGWINTQKNEINFLYQLYASDQFNEVYQNYWELELSQQSLRATKNKFDVYKLQEISHKHKFNRLIPEAQNLLASEALEKAKHEFELIETQLKRIVIDNDFYAAPSQKQNDILKRLNRLKVALAHQPKAETVKQRKFLRALYGVQAWDMSQDVAERQWKIKHHYVDLKQLIEQTELHEQRILAATQSLDKYDSFEPRIKDLDTQIDKSLNQLQLLSLKHQKLMRKLALTLLEDRKKEIIKLSVRAQLAAARLQDNVVTGGR